MIPLVKEIKLLLKNEVRVCVYYIYLYKIFLNGILV